MPSTATPGTVSPFLPPPSKDPGATHHVGSNSLAQYGLPWTSERTPQSRWQDAPYARSPLVHTLSRQGHESDQITHEARPVSRDPHQPYAYNHVPINGQGPRSTPTSWPPFGPASNFAVNGDRGLQLSHSPHDLKLPGGLFPTPPVDRSNRSQQISERVAESPFGVTKAGKARKRLEQACVSCRKKKTKCEPTSSSSKCLPCDKTGSECHFDST